MIKLVESASDKLLGLIAPKAVAEATLCACDTVQSWYQSCGCIGGYYYHKWVHCDGCHLSYGTCVKTSDRC